MKKIMITGHRPQKIGGFIRECEARIKIKYEILKILYELSNGKNLKENIIGISGMALGADQDFVDVCIENDIIVHAYLPGLWQPNKWNKNDIDYYNAQLSIIKEMGGKVFIADGDYDKSKLFQRNQKMVDDCDAAIAIYNGSGGGTKDALRALDKADKVCYIIDPSDFLTPNI